MKIQTINAAVAVLQAYLDKTYNYSEGVDISDISIHQPKGSEYKILEIEFLQDDITASLELRTKDESNFEIWDYDTENYDEETSEEITPPKKKIFENNGACKVPLNKPEIRIDWKETNRLLKNKNQG